MTATDIQVGDLIKATNKDNPEQTFTGRVYDKATDWFAVTGAGSRSFRFWNIEVLDRPLPPVEDELYAKAARDYAEAWDSPELQPYKPPIVAVINAVREFDRNKESSK